MPSSVLALGAIGSTLLMARFSSLAVFAPAPSGGRARLGLVLPWALFLVVGNVAFFASLPRHGPRFSASVDAVWSAVWPLLAGLGLEAVWRRARGAREPAALVPAGDIVVPVERALRWARDLLARLHDRTQALVTATSGRPARGGDVAGAIAGVEARLDRFGTTGLLTLLLLGLFTFLLLR